MTYESFLTGILVHDGLVKIPGYIEHSNVAILFQLEYTVSVPKLRDAKSPADSMDVVAGYTCHLPITAEKFELSNINAKISMTGKPFEKMLSTASQFALVRSTRECDFRH